MRNVRVVLAVLALIGCSGGSTGPKAPTFPDAGGVYQVSGSFDTLEGETFSGTMALSQPSRESGALSGALNLTLAGPVAQAFAANFTQVSITAAGDFSAAVTSGPSSWTFTGALSNRTIIGHHMLSGTSGGFPGSWQGTR